ncbi:autotransporter domain-containing protein [Brevundimonas naejangsanensis]|uniref:autotransporter domain-containing protein n=1 Tax=Brevundimonas naejangsanensis TaxID=588932 RepID=UPI0026E9276B|nr:autotransporter domain-containing protein [Brevundimonas naejangsanensis]
MINAFKAGLLVAVAGSALVWASDASAQAPVTPPTGGFYMADGSRTADYQAALASWRKDAQFSIDYSKAYLGLEHAYVLGLTGKGLTVGVNDAGVYMDHPLFGGAGKIKGLNTVVSDDYGNDGRINPRRGWEGHGTHVAGTIGGGRMEGELMFGNAFGANIYSATTNFAAGDFLWFRDVYINGDIVSTAQTNIIDLAATGEVRIINNSWGSSNSLPFNASEALVRQTFGPRSNYGDFYKPVLDNDVLVVFSTGNGGGAHAGIDAAAPMFDPRLRSNWLSVANYTAALTPSPSTSFCGQTATWCVAGPGHQIISAVPGFDFDFNAVLAMYRPADYMSLYTPTTVAALQNAALNRFVGTLNAYLNAKFAAETAGLPFDEAAARRRVAEDAVAITLISGGRMGDPDGFTAQLASLLTSAGNMAVLTPAFSSDVLTQANALLMQRLESLVSYTGPDYAAYTGTSMAAPNISGFAALLMEHFPEYDTALISDILLSSSLDLDTPGVDLKSGWGAPQMEVALKGPTALRDVRDVDVRVGTVDVWSNDIGDARDRYSAEVLASFPDDIGGIVKKGGGELILTGANDYTGATRVEGGLLTVNGSLINSTSTVAELGIMGGLGRLADVVVEKGGVLSPGDTANPFGTLTIANDLLLKDGSYLWIRSSLNGAQHSRVAVEGATTLEGGEVILKADQGEWNLRTRMNILQSAGGVTGTFTGAKSDLAFLKPILTYDANTVKLTLVRNDVTVASAGTTPNTRAVGGALDVMTASIIPEAPAGRNTALEDAILDGSLDNVRGALNSLTGEVHATLAGVATGDSRFIRDAMLTRGRNGTTEAVDGRGVAVWASGVFGSGRQDNGELADFRSETSGYLAGVEKTLNGRAHIGVAVGESQSEIRANRLSSTGEVKTQHIGVYGAASLGAFDFRLGGAWMDSRTRTDRTASLNRFNEQLTGRYDGEAWQAYGEVSWRKPVMGSTVLEPYLNYTRVEYDADVVERGGDAALSGQVSQTSDLLTAGLRTETYLAGGNGRPALSAVGHLAWTEDLSGDGPVFNAAFADGPVFRVEGADLNSGALQAGLGFNIEANKSTNIEVGYSGVFNDDYKDHRLTGRVSFRF